MATDKGFKHSQESAQHGQLKNPWSTPTELVIIDESSLGSGAFGLVWKARHSEDDTMYAIKSINVTRALRHFDSIEKIKREVELHAKLRSSFVVQYYNYWFEDNSDGVQNYEMGQSSSSDLCRPGLSSTEDDNFTNFTAYTTFTFHFPGTFVCRAKPSSCL